MRLINADKLSKNTCKGICSNCNDMYAGENVKTNCSEVRLYFLKKIEKAPTIDAIPISWIKNHIEIDRQSAEKAKAEKNDKLLHYHKTLEICASCLLFDWEDENGKYKEFEGEIWQD